MKVYKGLLVNIFRTNYDATNEGISNSKDNRTKLLLVSSFSHVVPEIFEEPIELCVQLKSRIINDEEYLYCVPLKIDTNKSFMKGPMFGGNFIYSSDSRFPSKYPIPIHDRYEH